MKIKAHIVAVADHGDVYKIEAQGSEIGAADWRKMELFEFRVANIAGRNRAFYVGRELTITIEPTKVRRGA